MEAGMKAKRKDLDTWNLKDIVRKLNSQIDTIEEIYLGWSVRSPTWACFMLKTLWLRFNMLLD